MIVMDVIQRNFFRLLRAGAFGCSGETIEPMSGWKWNVLYNISIMHGVTALVYDGIRIYNGDFFLNIPDDQTARWKKSTTDIESANQADNKMTAELFAILNHEQTRPILLRGQDFAKLYDNPSHRTTGDIDIFFPYAPREAKARNLVKAHGIEVTQTDSGTYAYEWNGRKVEHYTQAQRLTNIILNRRLQNIINKEIRCCDSTYIYIGETKIETLPPTLNLLLMLVRISSYILNEGVSIKQLVDLGIYIQKVSNNIDYEKLQRWINALHLNRMTQLEGALLMEFFNFRESDIPFTAKRQGNGTEKVKEDIFSFSSSHNDEWYFTQGKNIFVRASSTGAMTWHIKHLARFFPLYPSEAMTSFISSFAHSLSHIEE